MKDKESVIVKSRPSRDTPIVVVPYKPDETGKERKMRVGMSERPGSDEGRDSTTLLERGAAL
jgi:hypothetical protein